MQHKFSYDTPEWTTWDLSVIGDNSVTTRPTSNFSKMI